MQMIILTAKKMNNFHNTIITIPPHITPNSSNSNTINLPLIDTLTIKVMVGVIKTLRIVNISTLIVELMNQVVIINKIITMVLRRVWGE